MTDLSFSELRRKNVKRCEESFFPLDKWSPMEWGCAMAGEAGEACNKIKHYQIEDLKTTKNWQEIAHELADVVTYCDLIAARLGIELGEAVRDKFNIVSDRVKSEIKL